MLIIDLFKNIQNVCLSMIWSVFIFKRFLQFFTLQTCQSQNHTRAWGIRSGCLACGGLPTQGYGPLKLATDLLLAKRSGMSYFRGHVLANFNGTTCIKPVQCTYNTAYQLTKCFYCNRQINAQGRTVGKHLFLVDHRFVFVVSILQRYVQKAFKHIKRQAIIFSIMICLFF